LVFSHLDDETQRDICNYEFTVDLLQDMSDEDVYEVFARLNTYSYRLNAQELRHAKFYGDFRTCAYRLANEFVTFWEVNKIFSKARLLRMADAEFVSDLLIAMSDGIQEKDKKIIDHFYAKYDDQFPRRRVFEKRLREVIDQIGAIMDGTLAKSSFKSTRLLFPLFCAVYHMHYQLPELKAPQKAIRLSQYPKLKASLEQVDEIFQKVKEEGRTEDLAYLSAEERKFYKAYNVYWVRSANRKFLTSYLVKLLLR